MCIFIVNVYVFDCFKAQHAVSALKNDLGFLKVLKSFQEVEASAGTAAIKKTCITSVVFIK